MCGDKHVGSFLANLALGSEGQLGDDGVGVLMGNALGEPVGLFNAANFAQEFIDIGEAHAADDSLKADAAVIFLAQKAQQVDLVFISRSEIGVATLGGIRDIGAAVPDKEAFAESGSGGDESAIAG